MENLPSPLFTKEEVIPPFVKGRVGGILGRMPSLL
jgi:hypothetical protein